MYLTLILIFVFVLGIFLKWNDVPDESALLTAIKEVGANVNKKVSDAEASIADVVKKLNDAVTASKSLEDKVKNLETENADIKSKLRVRSGGGKAAEMEQRGVTDRELALYVRACFDIQKRGVSAEKAMSGNEFLRDVILAKAAEQAGIVNDAREFGVIDATTQKSLLTTLDSAIGFWIPSTTAGFLEIPRPNIITKALGVRGPVDLGAIGSMHVPKETSKVTWSPTAEGVAPSAQNKPQAGLHTVRPHEFTGKVQVSTKAMQAGIPSVGDKVRNHLMKGYAEMSDQQVLTATGVGGHCTGITNIPTSLLAGTVAATAGAIAYDEIIDIMAKVWAGNAAKGNYGFAMHPLVWAKILKLKDSQGLPIFYSAKDNIPANILGIPVYHTTQMPQGVASSTIIFGAWSNSIIYEFLGGVKVGFSEHENFSSQLINFLGTVELDVHHEYPTAYSTYTAITA